jgi:hypothetical protein
MDIYELKSRFLLSRNYATNDVNELMDFARKSYIQNEITIKEYRLLIGDLETHGAFFPDSSTESPDIRKSFS